MLDGDSESMFLNDLFGDGLDTDAVLTNTSGLANLGGPSDPATSSLHDFDMYARFMLVHLCTHALANLLLALTLSHASPLTCMCVCVCARTHTYADTHTRTNARAQTRARARARARTHTHTHAHTQAGLAREQHTS